MLRSDSESKFCYRFRFNCDRPFSESSFQWQTWLVAPSNPTGLVGIRMNFPPLHPFPFPLSITPSWHLQSVPTPWHVQNPPPMGPASPALSHLDTEVGILESWKRPMPDPRHCSLGATVFHHKRVAILTDVDLEHLGIPQESTSAGWWCSIDWKLFFATIQVAYSIAAIARRKPTPSGSSKRAPNDTRCTRSSSRHRCFASTARAMPTATGVP